MKITVLTPSERYLESAGVRIRYERIKEPLTQLGWTIDLTPIDAAGELLSDDGRIFLLSKCQDARALAFATAARRAGVMVGVDLFDDYFSQADDPRFVAQRLWLRAMAEQASFFLCSTERMLDIGNGYFVPGAGYVMSDPHEPFDRAVLKQQIAGKIYKAKRERTIPVLWFGICDNPSFPVGIQDLAAYAEALRPLKERSYKAHLTILTNRKALDGQALERLRRLPVPFVVSEWSKKREEEALGRSLVSFLPVNFQQFSIAKSPNRGVSALVGGTQLLTAGYSLYNDLRNYAYNDAARLIDDLESDSLKLSADNVAKFADWIERRAGAAAEVQGLVAFLGSLLDRASQAHVGDGRFAVMHGAKSTSSIDRFGQSLNWLTLASPLLPGGMKCDAHLGFFGGDPTLRLRVSEAALDHLPEELRISATWADESLGKGPSWEVPLNAVQTDLPLGSIQPASGRGACADAPTNSEILKLTRHFFMTIFEKLHIVESELDPVSNVIRALERN